MPPETGLVMMAPRNQTWSTDEQCLFIPSKSGVVQSSLLILTSVVYKHNGEHLTFVSISNDQLRRFGKGTLLNSMERNVEVAAHCGRLSSVSHITR